MHVTSEPKTKWDLKREASYEALLHAAMHCFHERGYAATRVQDVVEGTGYSPGAFYFHFQNKADCFWHVIAYRERRRGPWAALPRELDPPTTPLEDVLRRVLGGFAESLEGLNAWVLVMVDFHQQHRDDPETLSKLAEVYQRWRGELVPFVEALQAGGWVEKDRDPALVASQVFAFTEGMTTHAVMYGIDRETHERALLDGLVRLLRREGSPMSSRP